MKVTQIIENSDVMTFLAERKGQDLTGDDYAKVLKMCVSEKTCEARESIRIIQHDEMKELIAQVNVTLSALGAMVGQNTTSVAVINAAHSSETVSFKKRMAFATLFVAAFGIIATTAWSLVKPLIFK